jgi:hypothetical protein
VTVTVTASPNDSQGAELTDSHGLADSDGTRVTVRLSDSPPTRRRVTRRLSDDPLSPSQSESVPLTPAAESEQTPRPVGPVTPAGLPARRLRTVRTESLLSLAQILAHGKFTNVLLIHLLIIL